MRTDSIETLYRADRPWRTLAALYGPERRWALLGAFFYLIKASPVWALPVITKNLVDFIAHPEGKTISYLWLNALVGSVFIVQNIPNNFFYALFSSRAIRNVENRLRSALVRRLQMLSIAYHTNVSTGKLQTKVLRDVESIEQLSRQLLDTGLYAVASIIVAVVVTAWRMPAFLPVFLLVVPIVGAIRFAMAERLKRFNKKFRHELENMNAQVLGMINMIPVTRAHAAEEEAVARVESRLEDVRDAGQNFDRHAGLFGAVAWVAFMMFNLACLVVGALLSYRHIVALTPGDLVLLTSYFGIVVNAVMQLNAMLPIMTRGFDALRSIGEVLECPDIEENRDKQEIDSLRGEFRFENVSFEYCDAGETQVALRNVNFSVAPGETIGIAGPSGSGKSTLMSLIIGFHRPTAGRILLDGADTSRIDLRSYRRHLAVVTQDTILFDGTLRENIVYGTRNVTEAQLQSAVEAANAAEFIRELPRGLDTQIGEEGARLSGGQRQRVAIARALLRNPRVLILDEATSALDTGSEAAVQEALDRLMAGRTTFIVAHRLTTLRNADRILVLERGAIAEIGPHEELLRREEGCYARLQRAQTLSAGVERDA